MQSQNRDNFDSDLLQFAFEFENFPYKHGYKSTIWLALFQNIWVSNIPWYFHFTQL